MDVSRELIYLRPLQESDATVSYVWRNDPVVWEFTGNRPDRTVTPEIEKQWIRKVLARPDEKRFAICLRNSDRYIGNVQLTSINSIDAEFHIFIGDKNEWGKGLATIATQQILDHAFNELKLNSVFLEVKKTHTSAIKVYEKTGFRKSYDVDDRVIMRAFASKNKPVVSVFMMTYNHEKFIKQAIDGVLRQAGSYDYEIVIGDDCSKDKTRKIIQESYSLHPEKFKLLFHKKNIGAKVNQIAVLNACSGKYIAICEGDDYWLTDNKLEKQIGFLEAHHEYSMSFHAVYELLPDKKFKPGHLLINHQDSDYNLDDLAKGNFIYTPSVVYRNGLAKYPDWLDQSPIGDYVMHMFNASHGKVRYHAEPMAVYRRHGLGAWSMKSTEFRILNLIKTVDLLINDFTGKIQQTLVKQKANLYIELAKLKFHHRKPEEGKKYMNQAFEVDPALKDKWLTQEYPLLIADIMNARRYKLADKVMQFVRRIFK